MEVVFGEVLCWGGDKMYVVDIDLFLLVELVYVFVWNVLGD